MENFNNDDVKKMLEMLKEQAESAPNTQGTASTDAQTTDNSIHSDDDIKNMLKKHFSAEDSQGVELTDDYSFDTEDFKGTGEIETVDEESVEEITEEAVEELLEETAEETLEELVEEPLEEIHEETAENVAEEVIEGTFEEANELQCEPIDEIVDEVVDEVLRETDEDLDEAIDEITMAQTNVFSAVDNMPSENIPVEEEDVASEEPEIEEEPECELTENSNEEYEYVNIRDVLDDKYTDAHTNEADEDDEEEPPISEESINYDEVLEGQQGTVFNSFVEDFTGDLDDVVFEAEITDSHAPNKQYTIFEDWEQLMKDKLYETAEEGIIPPTEEELAHSAELTRVVQGNTDYFNPVDADKDLDAVDIALMVALGGENELNQTVGFEKILQAVHESKEDEVVSFEGEKIFGFCGEEYSSQAQNSKIKKKYKTDKRTLALQLIASAIMTLLLVVYETAGWMGAEFEGLFNISKHPALHILAGLQALFICVALSGNKLIKLFKDLLSFSSISFLAAIIMVGVNIINDILIIVLGYTDVVMTFHSVSAFLLLLSLIYDWFDVVQQAGVFDIASQSEKKLVLESYGKLRFSDDDTTRHGESANMEGYCITRVPAIDKYFARTSRSSSNITGKLVSLLLSLSIGICIMLVLVLMGEELSTIVLSFIITLSFTLICSAIFESEFAFFSVYKILKKYKTGIIGKSSVSEYGKCNIVYFDDFNIFNKKSVRTKGLKLYDNNEIYRILYHTQAVFSKVGGPLKGVFEFATSEMTHSKNVEIREIANEGIVATVDGRTSVIIGTGAFMKSRGIHPSYTGADLKLEESGEESIMFIALNGILGAKLYVTYRFSSEFERLARKLTSQGIDIGIRSSDPNINNVWAKKYGEAKKFAIGVVRPTIKEIKTHDKSIESGIVSTKNVRALIEALMMCTRLDSFEVILSKIRMASVVLVGILSFALVLLSGANIVCMLALSLACALCASVMMILTHFYIKR